MVEITELLTMLLSLPNELLLEVVENFSDPTDVFSLLV